MEINDDLVLKLENLAKLQLSTHERASIKEDLSKIVEMFSTISEVDTEGVEPLIHMTDAVNTLRKDLAQNSLTTDDVKVNAPLMKGRYFAVPKVID
jgi:aspartyl-tRNA(Asn)/glutamyl-tRNA(Gln) amidotransferase subunit C